MGRGGMGWRAPRGHENKRRAHVDVNQTAQRACTSEVPASTLLRAYLCRWYRHRDANHIGRETLPPSSPRGGGRHYFRHLSRQNITIIYINSGYGAHLLPVVVVRAPRPTP